MKLLRVILLITLTAVFAGNAFAGPRKVYLVNGLFSMVFGYGLTNLSKKMPYARHFKFAGSVAQSTINDIIADATDLTNTKRWFSGSTEGEVFRSIRDGAGVAMPPYKSKIRKEEDIWHLVNFVRSLWPKDQRPELVKEEPKAPAEGENE